ncbi:MAG: hypothetical protein KDD00_16790, partial [Ignavibacteriae bacterium]|nr:hypothetical protein [Ignavibacteriota bacterium]
ENNIESQRFLQFLHGTNELKSNKYVGVIHFQGNRINLLPKIFYNSNKQYTDPEITQIQNHILWWLSYCRKVKFPNFLSSLDNVKADFFEVLIYLFSKYTRELLNNSIYQQYQEISGELTFVKGRLNVNEYISENISKGKWHKLNCTYELFNMDNKFNRIIKYVTNLLFNVTTLQDNKKNLREILFILDEVEDEEATAAQCSSIKFNPMFGEFETVRDYCHLFLSNSVTFAYKNDLKLFAFLLPMEYIFEDFVFGFIDKEIPDIKAKSQTSSIFLDEDEIFNLNPDLFIETDFKSLIADTKYKIVYSDEKDPKKGISQSDLYQMMAYAVRFDVDEVMLFYPNTVNIMNNECTELSIIDELAGGRKINIKAFQLPVLNKEVLNQELEKNIDLSNMFEITKNELKDKIKEIIPNLI